MYNNFMELTYDELQYIDGGKDNIVFWGGVITLGICAVAVVGAGIVGAVVGGITGGPAGALAGAGIAASAAAKVVAPVAVGAVGAIALSLRH